MRSTTSTRTPSTRRTSASRSAWTAGCRWHRGAPWTCSRRGTSTAGTRPTRTWSARTNESGEGRALYGTFGATGFSANPARVDATNLRQAVKVYNKNGGSVFSATFGLRKELSTIIDAARRLHVHPLGGPDLADQLPGALELPVLAGGRRPPGPQRAALGVRPPAPRDAHRQRASCRTGFNAGLIYVGQSGTPYTWTVSGDVNADGISGNDLVFVPADASQITLQDPSQYEALSAFIDSQACLADSRGGFVQRGACRNPWQSSPRRAHRLDLARVRQGPAPRAAGGHLQRAQPAQLPTGACSARTRPSRPTRRSSSARWATTPRTTGRSTASPSPPRSRPSSARPPRSRWRMQVGARYVF